MKNRDVNDVNEATVFYEELLKMGQNFYQYLYGEHEEGAEAEEILRCCLEFYDADWIGCSKKPEKIQKWI